MTSKQAGFQIEPGTIVYVPYMFPHLVTPTPKFFVYVGERVDLSRNIPIALLLKINTNPKCSQSGIQSKYQFRLRKEPHYPFLEYDSHLDCGNVFPIEKRKMESYLEEDATRVIGSIIPDHHNEIIRLTSASRSINNVFKRVIRESL